MANYILSCCSVADLSKQHFEQRDIHYVCFNYEIAGKQYKDDLGQTIPFEQFYQMMADGAETKTSQVNVESYKEYFSVFLKEGKDILHIVFSSGLSGSLNSARIAKEELLEEFPERKIILVDSLAASAGYGLLMDKLADLRDEGKSMEEVGKFAEENRLKVNHYFFSMDLTYYIRGGRVSKAAGFVGQALNICPLLTVNKEGKLVTIDKIRTKRKTILTTLEIMKQNAENGLDYSGKCYISQSNCYEDAKTLADLIEQTFPKMNGKVEITSVGTTIGAHTGPGTVALFYWGKERTE